MFFKMVSGDVISLETNRDELLETQLSKAMGIPSFRIRLHEDEEAEDVYHVVVNDACHRFDLTLQGFIKDEDGLEYESYLLTVDQYDDRMDGYMLGRDEEWWRWSNVAEISFFHRYNIFRRYADDPYEYSLLEILSQSSVPENIKPRMIEEVFLLWEQR
jgi:hypothetical protein